MYCPLTPSLVCQHTCKAPQSWRWPNDRMRFFEAASSCCGLLAVSKTLSCLSYLVGERQSILQNPCLFQNGLDPDIIGGSVDLSRRLAQSNQSIFDFHMRIGAIDDRCVF